MREEGWGWHTWQPCAKCGEHSVGNNDKTGAFGMLNFSVRVSQMSLSMTNNVVRLNESLGLVHAWMSHDINSP